MHTVLNAKSVYVVSSFVAGFSVMVVELVSSRIVAPIIGASVFTWTSVIGLTLLGLAVGGWVGGKIADRASMSATALPLTFFLSALFIAIIPVLALHTDFITESSNSMLSLNLLLSSYLFLIPATAIGAIQPMLLKRYADDVALIGSRYGALSASWSLGSLVGVFSTGFFFISTIGSRETLWTVAVILAIEGALFALPRKKLAGFFVVAAVALAPLVSSLSVPVASAGIIYTDETDYFTAKVVDVDAPFIGELRALFLDFDTHSIELKNRNANVSTYTETYPIFKHLFSGEVSDILVIGGGAYTLPKHFAEYYPDAHVTVMETDPETVRIAEDYFNLSEYAIDTLIGDARILLAKDEKQYDVIFGDAYSSFISVPWYLLTKEWAQVVRERLTPGGIYAINFIGAISGPGTEFTESVAATFARVFPHYYVFSFGEPKSAVRNVVLIGVNGDLPLSEKELVAALKHSDAPYLAQGVLSKQSINTAYAEILTDDFSPVERLMEPIVTTYFPAHREFMKKYAR